MDWDVQPRTRLRFVMCAATERGQRAMVVGNQTIKPMVNVCIHMCMIYIYIYMRNMGDERHTFFYWYNNFLMIIVPFNANTTKLSERLQRLT
jgi:hypothetical protein